LDGIVYSAVLIAGIPGGIPDEALERAMFARAR
jgi:hypothetical protein